MIIVLSLAILAGLTSFFTWQALMRKPADLWAALPGNTEAVVRINTAQFFGKAAAANNEVLAGMRSLPVIGPAIRSLSDLDSLYRLSPTRFRGLDQSDILVAVAISDQGWSSYLLADASGAFGRNEWLDVLSLAGRVQATGSPDQYQYGARDGVVASIAFRDGLVCFRFGDDPLQADAKEDFKPPQSFTAARRKAGSKVVASLLVSNNILQHLLQSPDSLPRQDSWSNTDRGWSVLDINMKSKDIYLSGFALSGKQNLPDLLQAAGQDAGAIPNKIPPEAIRWSRLGNIEASRVLSPSIDSLAKVPEGYLRCFEIFLQKDAAPLYVLESVDTTLLHRLRSENPGLTPRRASKSLMDALGGISTRNPDTSAIWLMGYESTWVAGRDQAKLRKLVADLRGNRTISEAPWFSELIDKLPDEASLWGRIHLGQGGNSSSKAPPLYLSWAVQNNTHPLLSLVLSNESSTQGKMGSRPLVTSGNITHRPFAIWNQGKKRYDILVFDNTHTATLYTPLGELVWDYPLDGIPLGNIQLLDPKRNGQWMILFNTATRIYLLDLRGYDAEGFPIDLSPPATNPVAAFDYDGRKDYRLFVATADGNIRNIDIRGKEVASWSRPRIAFKVSMPAQHLAMYDKDYLIFPGDDGQVLMTDRKGDERVSVKRAFSNAAHTPFFLQRIEGETRLITTDRQGNVQALLRNGKVATTRLEEFSNKHSFLYAPYTTDRASDYIFLDGNRLVVYARNGKKALEWTVPGNPTSGPEVLRIGPLRYLAVADSIASNVYLFKEGDDDPAHQIMGRFIPVSIDLDQDLRPELLTAELRRVIMQPLQR
jgi:hypothetical protein